MTVFGPAERAAVERTVADLDPAGPPALRVVARPADLPDDLAGQSLAVLPGSFNPPHRAHLELIDAALASGSDLGAYALSTRIVDKEQPSGIPFVDRLLLLRAIAAGQHAAGVLFLNRGLYVDQAAIIQAAFPRLERLDFVVGYDKIVQIFDPRYYDDRDGALARLFDQAGFFVAPRSDKTAADIATLLERPENRPFAAGVRLLELPPDLANVSSTRLREAEGDQNDLPPIVARYVAETGTFG